MKRAWIAFAVLLPACGSNLFGKDDAGAGGAATSDAGAGGAQADAAVGADCTSDLGSGVKLCTYLSICPALGIDHDQFPNCGFRVRGGVIDIECICNGTMLCPMGAPTSCEQAKTLLLNQNELVVCQQIDQGLCSKL